MIIEFSTGFKVREVTRKLRELLYAGAGRRIVFSPLSRIARQMCSQNKLTRGRLIVGFEEVGKEGRAGYQEFDRESVE